jgi:ferredoxin
MADLAQKVAENVAGRFFVDATCIDCDLCREVAPAHFTRQDDEGYSFVIRQPAGPDEEAACVAALEECPVEAIGIIDHP